MVSSACFNLFLLPPVLRPQIVTFRCVPLSTANPQRCGVGAKNRISNLRNIGWTGAVAGKVTSTEGVPTVSVLEANELLQAGERYLDVRTSEEFIPGHVPGAINVPYMFKDGSGMTMNPHFLEEVLSHFGKDDKIIVGCQVGKRSIKAATDLLCDGFTGVTNMAGGYAAWVENGLPIEF